MTTISTVVVVYASLLTLDWTADQVQANKLCEKYCGQKSRSKSCFGKHRVLGGHLIERSSMTWRALIETTLHNRNRSFCSASLVCVSNFAVIITAAHCFYHKIQRVKIYLEAFDIKNPYEHHLVSDYYSIIMKKRSRTIQYKTYGLAVIKLADDILSKSVIPLCMPQKADRLKAKERFELLGYGADTAPDGTIRRLPRTATYVLHSLGECEATFPPPERFDKNYEICGRSKYPLIKAQSGDSGGPVVRNNILLAVAERIMSYATSDDILILTDVLAYSQWLKNAVKHFADTERHGIYELSFGDTLTRMRGIEPVESPSS